MTEKKTKWKILHKLKKYICKSREKDLVMNHGSLYDIILGINNRIIRVCFSFFEFTSCKTDIDFHYLY